MRRPWAVIGILLIVAASLLFFLSRSRQAETTSAESAAQNPAAAQAGSTSAASKSIDNGALGSPTDGANSGTATSLHPANNAGILPPVANSDVNLAPATVLENVRTAIRQYGDMWGGNPVGTNPEITSALNGNNPKQINFINTEAGMRINDQGELVDPWGTPLFFHQLSAHEMEIRSAGPDKKMWTADDLAVK